MYSCRMSVTSSRKTLMVWSRRQRRNQNSDRKKEVRHRLVLRGAKQKFLVRLLCDFHLLLSIVTLSYFQDRTPILLEDLELSTEYMLYKIFRNALLIHRIFISAK